MQQHLWLCSGRHLDNTVCLPAHWVLHFSLQLAGTVGVELLEKDDPVLEWRERVFKEFEETISKNGKYQETTIQK